MKDFDVEVGRLGAALKDVKIPNYIIEMPILSQEEDSDLEKVKRLL